MAPGAAAGYASPMRKPYAKALCTRVLLKDRSTRGGGLRPPLLNGGAAASGRRPPVEESLVDTLEEDPGAQCFRIGLAHRAGAYPAAAPGAICCHIVLDVATYPPPPRLFGGWGGVGGVSERPLPPLPPPALTAVSASNKNTASYELPVFSLGAHPPPPTPPRPPTPPLNSLGGGGGVGWWGATLRSRSFEIVVILTSKQCGRSGRHSPPHPLG